MADSPKRAKPLGYKAQAHVEEALIRMNTAARLTVDVDEASARSNHALVVALTASIRGEIDAASAALRNAALGR